MSFAHIDYAAAALPVAAMPHQVDESEAVGGPSLRLSGFGSPAEIGLPQTALPAPGQSPLTGRHVFWPTARPMTGPHLVAFS